MTCRQRGEASKIIHFLLTALNSPLICIAAWQQTCQPVSQSDGPGHTWLPSEEFWEWKLVWQQELVSWKVNKRLLTCCWDAALTLSLERKVREKESLSSHLSDFFSCSHSNCDKYSQQIQQPLRFILEVDDSSWNNRSYDVELKLDFYFPVIFHWLSRWVLLSIK